MLANLKRKMYFNFGIQSYNLKHWDQLTFVSRKYDFWIELSLEQPIKKCRTLCFSFNIGSILTNLMCKISLKWSQQSPTQYKVRTTDPPLEVADKYGQLKCVFNIIVPAIKIMSLHSLNNHFRVSTPNQIAIFFVR